MIAGVVLMGGPVAAMNYWLSDLIGRQGRAEIEASARRAAGVAETRLSAAVAGLSELEGRNVDSCRPANLELMRQALFATTPIKEISIVAADGQTLCTDLGIPLGSRRVLSSLRAPGLDAVVEVLRVGDYKQSFLRLRRPSGRGGVALAALIPADMLLPQVSQQGAPFTGYAQVAARDGTVLAQFGSKPETEADSDYWVAQRETERFGLIVTVAVPRSSTPAGYSHLQVIGAAVTGLVGVIILGFAAIGPRRRTVNPIEEIEHALERGEFVPYYHPVVDIKSGRLLGAEVLVRWRKADGTVVAPGAFIPLVESSGLILEMTRMLMRRARDEMGPALGRRPRLKLSFNLTARHFTGPILDDVKKIFGGSPLKLSQVVLELTERQPLENLTATRRVIAELQGIGVQIAIDDVGTGHSGLSYMLKLGVDIIKIDKMFIDAIGSDRNSMTIIETLVDLARNMRMEVVAEGVENFEQVVYLREHGISAAQGYVFAPPLPGASFLQLLEAIDPLPADAAVRRLAARRLRGGGAG